MPYDKDGHLFGDAVFESDYWVLQNTDKEELIKYSRDGGLVISGASEPTEDSGVATKEYVDNAIDAAILQAIGGSY